MNDLIKITGIGFMGGMMALTVRKERPEFALMTALITSAVILGYTVASVSGLVGDMCMLIEECGMDIKYFSVCIKAVGLAYISQFAAEILRDGGENAIASKIEAAGKISILVITMPIMSSFLSLCVRIVNEI